MKIKKKSSLLTKSRIIKSIIMLIVIALIGSGVYLGFTVYQQIKDFDINKLTTSNTSQLIAADGKSYYTYGAAQGKYVKYKNIPENLIDAIVSAEDSRYFVHDGFDVPRIIKALYTNIVSKITGSGGLAGGSTITQQLIKKTYYPNEEKTIQRKLGEAILAAQATKLSTKEKIIELYLNKIYFGTSPNTVGIYAASKYYFDKTPDQLTLPESALLAGTINSPVYYDPFNNIERAQNRRNIILTLMYNHGYITEKQKIATQKVPVANTLKSNPIKSKKNYAAYVDTVTAEVKSKTNYDPTTTNMTIYTYLDKDVQTEIENILSEKTYYFSDDDMQVGGSVQEVDSGRIVGIMGGRNYGTSKNYINYANVKNQPGSSIKPILDYGPAFEYLYWSTGHIVSDAAYSSGGWNPQNWDRRYHGNVTLYNALGNSWNLAAINTFNEVQKEVGKNKLIKWLKKLGYTDSALKDTDVFNASYAIGGWSEGTTPIQQAAAYAAMSNGGTYIEPHTVEKIVINTTGETIYLDEEAKVNATQAFSDSTAFMLRNVLTQIVKDYSSFSLVNAVHDEIGAKTGTSTHSGAISGIPAGVAKDNWFCCFSPSYSWAVWNGYPSDVQKSKHKYILSGQNESRKIAARIAQVLHNKVINKSYDTPDSVVKARYIKGVYPYQSPTSSTPSYNIGEAWFTKGHTPSGKDTGTSTTTTQEDLSSLSSFTASVTEANAIRVTFTSYPGSSSGIVYKVQIYNGSTLVTTRTLSSNTGTIDFGASPNTTYTVVGYYARSSGSETSNKISKTVTTGAGQSVGNASFSVTSNGSAVSSGATISGSSITVATSGSSSNKITITLSGSSSQTKTVTAGESATFSGLPSGGSFTLSLSESNGTTSANIGSHSFKTKAATQNNDEEDDEDEDDENT